MEKTEKLDKLHKAMVDFSTAYDVLARAIEEYEQESGTSVNDLPNFTESYPFDKSFDEIDIALWVRDVVEYKPRPEFSVLNYDYVNTGGNTMVGVAEVWLPEEKKTVYALFNEEGCTLSVVDYIRNEILDCDYDELMIEVIDWGRLTGHEDYFELYRHCLNEYTKSDCKYFGITRRLPKYLLSDELQKQVTEEYLDWLHAESDGCIETDGSKIIVEPDYEPDIVEEDGMLTLVKKFKEFHDSTAAVEDYYCEDYVLSFAGHTVRLPFAADVWEAINNALETTIENW